MAESHVVSGLVAKRGELAGEAEHCRRELHRLVNELGHLDATIRLFDPDYDLGGIPPRKRRRGQHWFGPRECQRLMLDVLLDAGGPLSDQGVTIPVAARKGLQDRPEVLVPLQKTTLAGKGVARVVGLADGVRGCRRSQSGAAPPAGDQWSHGGGHGGSPSASPHQW
jgi:hypothetical protein